MSDEDYKKMTGRSIEDLRVRIKKHVEDTIRKAGNVAPTSK